MTTLQIILALLLRLVAGSAFLAVEARAVERDGSVEGHDIHASANNLLGDLKCLRQVALCFLEHSLYFSKPLA